MPCGGIRFVAALPVWASVLVSNVQLIGHTWVSLRWGGCDRDLGRLSRLSGLIFCTCGYFAILVPEITKQERPDLPVHRWSFVCLVVVLTYCCLYHGYDLTNRRRWSTGPDRTDALNLPIVSVLSTGTVTVSRHFGLSHKSNKTPDSSGSNKCDLFNTWFFLSFYNFVF